MCFCNTNAFNLLQKRKPQLAYDELTTVRKNLETQNVDVDNEFVSFFFCVAEVSRMQNDILIEIVLRGDLL